MKLGIDIDGVILDSESYIRTYAELYDLTELNGKGVQRKDELKLLKRYDWTEDNFKDFAQKYFVPLTKMAALMPASKVVLEKLREEGNELVIITARGGEMPEMRIAAEEVFERENMKFDRLYWNKEDKLETCVDEKVDYMIDDNYDVCKRLSENNIKTIYFREKGMKKLEENEYLKEVSSWGEIYRFLNTQAKSETLGEIEDKEKNID